MAFPSPPNQVDRRVTRPRNLRAPCTAPAAVKSSKMPNKMLIDATHPEETRVVVVRGNRVEEFDFETAQRKQLRGNIYLAKVTRVEPSLQAAFIEYGGNRHGFLAFSEIHPDYYQIPVADRQALIEADERAHREAEEESENRSSSRRRPLAPPQLAPPRPWRARPERRRRERRPAIPRRPPQPYDGERITRRRRVRRRSARRTTPSITLTPGITTMHGASRHARTTTRRMATITIIRMITDDHDHRRRPRCASRRRTADAAGEAAGRGRWIRRAAVAPVEAAAAEQRMTHTLTTQHGA